MDSRLLLDTVHILVRRQIKIFFILCTTTELSRARQEAFDNFRKNMADTSAMEQHKKILKKKSVIS